MNKYYSMQEAARAIGISCLGRNKVYYILKDLGIVDESNRPDQKYVDAGLLKRQEVFHETPGKVVVCNVTLAVDNDGLRFIRDKVFEYLKENTMPNFPHCRRTAGGTTI